MEQFFEKTGEEETEKIEVQAELVMPGSEIDASDDEQYEDESESASPSKKKAKSKKPNKVKGKGKKK